MRPSQVATPLKNAARQGLFTDIFAADLKHNKAGSYTFGSIPKGINTSAITYTPISTSIGQWMFTPTGYIVGAGKTVTKASASVLAGIADTGTTLMLLDSSIAAVYYKNVTGAAYSNSWGGYVFKCGVSLPAFTLVIGSYKAVVPGPYINYAPNGDGSE